LNFPVEFAISVNANAIGIDGRIFLATGYCSIELGMVSRREVLAKKLKVHTVTKSLDIVYTDIWAVLRSLGVR